MNKFYKDIVLFFLTLIFFNNVVSAKDINEVKIIGNDRISDETIIVFSDYKNNKQINDNNINKILKNLYDTNFFKDVTIKTIENTLIINVIEEPLIQTISINGLAQSMKDLVYDAMNLKNRSSFNDFFF